MATSFKFKVAAAAMAVSMSTLVAAAPSVVGATGTLSDGGSVSITGGGFGTKAKAAPFYWDDYEARTLGKNAVESGLDNLGNDGQGFPYVANDVVHSGSRAMKMDYLTNKDSMFPRIGKGGMESTEVFASAWVYWRRTAGSGNYAFIFKLMRGGTYPTYSGIPRFYETVMPGVDGTIIGADRGSVSSAGVTTYASETAKGPSAEGWHRIDYYFKLSTPGAADGAYQASTDYVLNSNIANVMNRAAGNTSLINYVMSPFDGNDSYGLSNGYALWVDDFYIDTTRARVEIGDAATLGTCTTRLIQPTTQWADGSITFQPKLASFGSGKKVYVYVFDANGIANSQGYAMTVGSVAATASPPSSPVLGPVTQIAQ